MRMTLQAVGLMVAMVAHGVGQSSDPAPRGRTVVIAPGTICPESIAAVDSGVAGRVKKIVAEDNAVVKKGDVLAEFDSSMYRTETTRPTDVKVAEAEVATEDLVDVNSLVLGRIRKIHPAGDWNGVVKKGDPLAELDSTLFEADLRIALAQIRLNAVSQKDEIFCSVLVRTDNSARRLIPYMSALVAIETGEAK